METDRFEIPKEMRAMAEASFDQARKAFEDLYWQRPADRGDIRRQERRGPRQRERISAPKAISFAEKNVQASLTYAQQLIHAKDLTGGHAPSYRICAGPDATPWPSRPVRWARP